MNDNEPNSENLPTDSHLQEDISVPAENADEQEDQYLPGQTNAGQRVAGLASAPDYGKNHDDPESEDGANHPV